MRILIIALVTLNILYFVGVYLFSVAFDRPPPLKEPGIPTIKLLAMNAGEASYAIIDSGPYKNAIALGTFSDLDKARRHTEYIRFLGYDAKHTEQQQRAIVFWVSYDDTFSEPTPVIAWSKAIDPNSVVQKISEACEY